MRRGRSRVTLRRAWPARLLGGALAAGAAVLLVRSARGGGAGPADGPSLRTEWSVIRGIAGADRLRIRARVGDAAPAPGPPIVLVPGFGVGSSYLLPLARRLARRARVYVPEPPGHGLSDHDARPLRVPELAVALAAWMDVRGVRAAVLVGHSLGCQVVAELAASRRDLVAGMVLVGPTSDPAVRTAAQQIARGVAASLFDRPSYLARAARDYWRAGPRVLVAEMREMVDHRIESVLPGATAPARVVRGGRDRIVPPEWAAEVAGLVGAPPPTVVPGWGHAVHYDDPGPVARVTLELARSLTATGEADPPRPARRSSVRLR